MARSRLPDAGAGTRRTAATPALLPAATEHAISARDLLLRSWAGRLFLAAAGLKVVIGLVRQPGDLPLVVRLLNSASTIGLAVAVGFFLWRLFVLMRRRLLWRLRRRLILSYIFIGVVPALLIIGFVVLSAGTVSMNVSAYLFRDGYDAMIESVGVITQAAAGDVARDPKNTAAILR